jgi:tRNA (mo5U34)-methyltransferase
VGETGQIGQSLRDRVDAIDWYHTLELAPGVVTPGWFDTRSIVSVLPLPESLEGMRCLDVGTFDGFWAFEMERRGGSVTAIDVLNPRDWDWPTNSSAETIEAIGSRKGAGTGFEIARDALGSRVERQACNVYDLDPELVGEFDFVYVGSLLLHLRDPVRALERIRTVCRGKTLVVDTIDLRLTLLAPGAAVATLDGIGRPWWWKPNVCGLVRMLEAAGFTSTIRPRRVYMPPGAGQPLPRLRDILRHPRLDSAITSLKGDPHAAVLARPA